MPSFLETLQFSETENQSRVCFSVKTGSVDGPESGRENHRRR